MTNEVQVQREQVPDHLRQFAKTKIGNVDRTDLIIPRIKLIQAISPELQEFDGIAKAGMFWHTIASANLGATLMAIPIIVRKSYVLWAPRNDDRGILARAMDGVHWDSPNTEFTVKPKGSPNSVTYNTKGSVAESGLGEFGSSIPGDPQSKPAASLTYNVMWYLLEFPDLSPSVIINTRSSIKPMQQLLSKIDSKPVAHFVQVYNISAIQQKGAEGPFFNFAYTGAGFADVDTAKVTEDIYNQFADKDWLASEEEPDVESDAAGGERPARAFNEEVASKF